MLPSAQQIKASIGSDNDLVPDRLQSIIWTIVGLAYWRIYALGINELMNTAAGARDEKIAGRMEGPGYRCFKWACGTRTVAK